MNNFTDLTDRTKQYAIPHPEYAKRTFVLAHLKTITGDYFCPVCNRRVKDITLQK